MHAVEFPYPGAPKRPVSYPLIIKPQTVPVFFPVRHSLSPAIGLCRFGFALFVLALFVFALFVVFGLACGLACA